MQAGSEGVYLRLAWEVLVTYVVEEKGNDSIDDVWGYYLIEVVG
jgi:hypothetical protein